MASGGALSHLKVVDLTQGIAGPHCSALLAGLGAEVIKVERPPRGDPARRDPLLFAALNGGKRSVAIDLRSDRSQLLRLLDGADALVESYRPGTLARLGLAPGDLLQRHPRLVITSVTSFGQTGPYRGFEATEIVALALGGLLALTGDPQRPPLRSAASLAQYAAGVFAAVGTLVALAGVRAGLPGQHVDVSIMEAVLECLEHTFIAYTHRGVVRRRMGSRHPDNHPMTIWPCRDGFVGVSVGFGQWDLFCALTGRHDLAGDPELSQGHLRRRRADEIDATFGPWFAERSAREIVEGGQTFRLPFGHVLSPGQLLDDPHLRARDFFVRVGDGDGGTVVLPGAPFRLSAAPWRHDPPPRLDEDGGRVRWRSGREAGERAEPPPPGDGRQPLEGIRVLDVTHQWAGPFATRLLADHGADVIKIESPGRVDSVRYAAFPQNEPGQRPWNRGGYFHKQNRNKRSLTIDLAQPLGAATFRRLAALSDVVVDNYSPRVMPQFGLGAAALLSEFPRLVVVTMPAYGEGGPYSDWVAFGTTLEGMSGIASLTRYAGGPPMRLGVAFPDAVAGAYAALAALAALEARARSGAGQHVEVAQREAAITFIAEHVAAAAAARDGAERIGDRPRHVVEGVYPCQGEDAWLAVAVRDALEWDRLAELLDVPVHLRSASEAEREAARDEIDARISDWTSARAPRDAMLELQRAGIPAGAVLSNKELLEDPHLAARRFFQTVDHPDTGPHRYVGFAAGLSRTPATIRLPGPALGAHNEAILRDLLGMTDAEVAALAASGVIADRPRGM